MNTEARIRRLESWRRFDAKPERKHLHSERVKAAYHALSLSEQFALASNRYVRLTLKRSEQINAADLTLSSECFYCWRPPTGWDHVVPLRHGGQHTTNNLVPCCRPCNSSKGQSTPDEWLGRGLVAGWFRVRKTILQEMAS